MHNTFRVADIKKVAPAPHNMPYWAGGIIWQKRFPQLERLCDSFIQPAARPSEGLMQPATTMAKFVLCTMLRCRSYRSVSKAFFRLGSATLQERIMAREESWIYGFGSLMCAYATLHSQQLCVYRLKRLFLSGGTPPSSTIKSWTATCATTGKLAKFAFRFSLPVSPGPEFHYLQVATSLSHIQ